MKTRIYILLVLLGVAAPAQLRTGAPAEPPSTNLPAHPAGPNDLLSVSVYGSPELSKTARVGANGEISLPMLEAPIPVGGQLPSQIEQLIAARFEQEKILIDPVVTVSVAEYASRPVTVAGAVKNPLTFQATGRLRLLEAISRAGGFMPEAGNEVIITANREGNAFVRRIQVKSLLSGSDDADNPVLSGGEEVRVPESGRVFVVGNVKKPGAYPLRDAQAPGMLQVLALAEGLAPYSSKTAYIFRPAESGGRQEIAVALKDILRRKKSDVEIFAGDIVYIPDNKTGRLGIAALERVLLFGSTAGAAALIYAR